jgi:superfamily II DNA/RNA helicase
MTKDRLIKCYHKLLEVEREKLREYLDEFSSKNRLTKDEIITICKKFGINFDDLLKERLLIKYPDGKFRTMHYDMIFRMINIRVHEYGTRIPLEYKIYQYTEPIPDFTEKTIQDLEISDEIKEVLIKGDRNTISNFQYEYIKAILQGQHKAYVISAPPATGKSLIFTVPLLEMALKRKNSILIYPRKALASDQLMVLLEFLTYLNEILKKDRRAQISIGIDDSDTPKDDDEARGKFRGIDCPICKRENQRKKLLYSKERRVIVKCERGHVFDFIVPTKELIWKEPPSILVTNGWILNRRLMEQQAQNIFKQEYKYIILDEAHVYREETGAHIHYVISRLKKKLSENTEIEPSVIISSATLPKNTLIQFCSRLVNTKENEIFWEQYERLMSRDKQKMVIHLVLLPNPFSSAESLAENILLFLTVWSYFQKKKSIFFVDSVHEIHRLYHFVHNIIIKGLRYRALEHLKSIYNEDEPHFWAHYSEKKVTEKDEYLVDEFANSLTYHYGGLDPERRFEIEEEFKKGLKKCLLSTSTLELGIDIGDLSAIAQFRYPASGESYIQRVGRAGRSEDSYYVTISILILSNSPTQLKYLYGEETPTIFRLPPDYRIPLPLENDIIREHHSFFAVLDLLARHRPTFISPSEIKDNWRGKTYKDVITDCKRLLKDGISVAPDKRDLLEKYIAKIQHREDILNLSKDVFEEEETPAPIKFKAEKLDSIRDLEEWFSNRSKDLDKNLGSLLPSQIKEFFVKSVTDLSQLNERLEHAHKHYEHGNREAFEKVCKNIEKDSKYIREFLSKGLQELNDKLHELWNKLRQENAPISMRELIDEVNGEIKKIKEKADKIELTYNELLAYFSNVVIEIEHYLKRQWWDFNIITALNLLGTSKYISLLFEKPLPKIEVVYPGLPRKEEYLERTIDALLWLCTPFRVTPLKEKYYYTVVFGLQPWKFKIKGLQDYQPFEGGDIFTFNYSGRRYTAVTPHFIYMLNLNENIVEANSDSFGQDSKIILSNKKGSQPYDLEACRFCTYGFVLTSKQTNVCPRTIRDCSYFTPCKGTKFFQGPKEPFIRTSYLSLLKVYPKIYSYAKEPDHIIETIPIIENGQKVTLRLFQGSMFDRALVGCYMVSSGKVFNFVYPPTFNLVNETLGYRISTNGIRVEFDREKLKNLIADLLKIPEVYAWIILKYLISVKYYTERGDLKFEYCSRAFEGLFDEESGRGTKRLKEEFEKLLKKKEINDDILDFAINVFLHSFSHLFYQYLLDKLQTNEDNIAYYVDRDNCFVYMLENAEKGLGLTETLQAMIKKENGKDFFIKFLEYSMKILADCDYHKNRIREIAIKELEDKTKKLGKKDKEIFNDMLNVVIKAKETLQKNYGIDFPIEILRSILVERYPSNRMIMDAIISQVPYCWDGCYNCVRLERSCVYGPFNQITRVSKILFAKVIERIFTELKIPVKIGKGFGWVLEEINKTKKELRISSPWISIEIVKQNIEPLLKKDIIVKIITREDLENEEQVRTLNYLNELTKKYKSLQVKFIDEIHAKLILVDDNLGIKGSLNLTFSGLYKNIELVEKYTDKNEIGKLIRDFDNVFAKI